MNATLVRVGVDQAFGGWNAPVDPDTLEFVYVPIPESDDRPISPRLATTYADVVPALESFAASRDVDRRERVLLPPELAGRRRTHLDPDFAHLTYGDDGTRRGKGLTAFEPGDLVVFFAGLRPCRPCEHRLIYAIIGALRVAEVVRAGGVPKGRRGENAHTRRADVRATDVIVRGEPGRSGRLRRALPIGSFRWQPVEMPLRFEDAPVLLENRLAAPPSALRRFLRGTNRDTPVAQFASRFRSRSSALPPDVAREVVELWERAVPRARRSNSYVDSLPYPPPAPRDAKGRKARFAELLEEMGVGRPRGRRC